ncbi:hypothetical protein H9P43_008745 [Blastocladiella emersonii ATCC 22665]|nr:hypothetical protein H9P43_008745 [Blastocladiella emersonii ATCC 22665]
MPAASMNIVPAAPVTVVPAAPTSVEVVSVRKRPYATRPPGRPTKRSAETTVTDPVDGTVHVRPAASYPQLIAMALTAAPSRQLTVREIYHWILDQYPFYRFSNVAKVLKQLQKDGK